MDKVNASQAGFSSRLERVVKEGLSTAGIKAVTMTERVPGTKLIRLIVMAAAFEQLGPTERQNLVWRIIDSKFSSDEQMRISLVVALSKKELGQRLRSELGAN